MAHIGRFCGFTGHFWSFEISVVFYQFLYRPLLAIFDIGRFWPISASATFGRLNISNIFEPRHQQNPNKWMSWTKTQDHSPLTHPKSTESCDQMHLIYDSVKQGWSGSSHSWRLQTAPFLEFFLRVVQRGIHLIFEINLGERRIRHSPTRNLRPFSYWLISHLISKNMYFPKIFLQDFRTKVCFFFATFRNFVHKKNKSLFFWGNF